MMMNRDENIDLTLKNNGNAINDIKNAQPIHERRNSQVLVHHINGESQFDESQYDIKEDDGSMIATQFSEQLQRLRPT